MFAARDGEIATVRSLLSEGVDVNVTDEVGVSSQPVAVTAIISYIHALWNMCVHMKCYIQRVALHVLILYVYACMYACTYGAQLSSRSYD